MYEYSQSIMQQAIIKANCALVLERRITGMKFLFTRSEFEAADASKLQGRLSYCNMILKAASEGISLKADFDNFGCFGGARALGIVEDDAFYTEGRFFEPRGLYQDLAISREVTSHIHRCQHKIYGVLVQPADCFKAAPDVVLIISNPRNIMRLMQGYTYSYGTATGLKMVGNQAICAEATAHPYLENGVNITCLCAGPRSVGMREYEMAMGIVFNKFFGLIHGLCMTITAVECDSEKERIRQKFLEHGVTDIPVISGRNYRNPFLKRDLAYFTEQLRQKNFQEEELLPDIFKL